MSRRLQRRLPRRSAARWCGSSPVSIATSRSGTAPTATANDHYLPAGVLEYLRVVAGEKVAFLRAGTLDGIVTVTDME